MIFIQSLMWLLTVCAFGSAVSEALRFQARTQVFIACLQKLDKLALSEGKVSLDNASSAVGTSTATALLLAVVSTTLSLAPGAFLRFWG